MTNVRTFSKRRKALRLRYATTARFAALSRETGVSIDMLRTFAGITDPRNAHLFSRESLVARITPENRHPPLPDDDEEPPRLELKLQPADLDDGVYADINPPRTNLARLRAQLEKKRRPP